MAAYRGVLTYEQIFREIPEARAFLGTSADIWTGPNGFVLTYPISAGTECNIVTAYRKDDYVLKPEPVDIDEFRGYYRDFHPVVQRLVSLVAYTQRWPLLQMPKLERWSNQKQNVVLMGDAAHAMHNTMAQGAAVSMQDGAFLGRVLSEVVRSVLTLPEAISLYEQQRIPKAWSVQQLSFISGVNHLLTDEAAIRAREEASAPLVKNYQQNPVHTPEMPSTFRSWQLWDNDVSVPGIFYYDAEADADNAVSEYLQKTGNVSELEGLSDRFARKFYGFMSDNGFSAAEAAPTA
jgi:salicylate hydroxylase